MASKYVIRLTEEERLVVCNALHTAYEEARRLRDREEAMGLGKQFVLAQERHAKTLQNLFFRLINTHLQEAEKEDE